MTAGRFLFVLFFGVLPLAALRELWWSPILFAEPWAHAGGGVADFGPLTALLSGWFAAGLTLMLGLLALLLLDLVEGAWPYGGLALAGLLALALSVLTTWLHPNVGGGGFWPLLGFFSLALIWLSACLKVQRRS